jgi:hypothetical protein
MAGLRIRAGGRAAVFGAGTFALIAGGLIGLSAADADAQVRAAAPGGPAGGRTSVPGTISYGVPHGRTLAPIGRQFPVTAAVGTRPTVVVHPGFVQRGRTHVSGTTFRASGSVEGDRFSLDFTLGTDPALLLPKRHVSRPVIIHPGSGYWCPTWGYRTPYRYQAIQGAYYQPVHDPALTAPVYQPPPAPPEEPAEPPTIAEIADEDLRAGDATGAANLYREYLRDNPDEMSVMRSLGIALISDGRVSEGVATIAMAYRESPELADTPIDAASLFRDQRALRRCLTRVVHLANREQTPSAWLAVAAIMQAENRNDHALRMARRAEAAGLEAEVSEPLLRALGG